ncbi:MAG: bifunctional methylenetetrahydrofolate dehydrogenase/methenyltetrahydrofolate cyclohydrolase FolD [Candidatus Margulisiibacteriota bacterium]
MPTRLLDGSVVSNHVLDSLKTDIQNSVQTTGKRPGLAVILVGDNPASQTYVGAKKRACEAIGIASFEFLLPKTASETDIESLILELNARHDVHGILLQLPLPKGLNESRLLRLIAPEKDVDGFHPINIGNLLLGEPCLKSCTPYGVMALLSFYNIDPKGKHVVIVGRSNIVGKPQMAMMLQANATVTICHSQTQNLASITQQADILVAAIGKPRFITADMVNPNAVVIDVGINRIEDPNSPKGYKLVGDVDFDAVVNHCCDITPVPGGVGKMTIAMLMQNTVEAFQKSQR